MSAFAAFDASQGYHCTAWFGEMDLESCKEAGTHPLFWVVVYYRSLCRKLLARRPM